MSICYILKNGSPVLEPDVLVWARWYKSSNAERGVAQTVIGDVRVATVFLGIDYGYVLSNPILFETMVFGGLLDHEQERYHTREEALTGHERWCARVREVVAS